MLTQHARRLIRFINRRNESPHNSNLQFQIDMEACNISKDDIGEAIGFDHPDFGRCFRWSVLNGKGTLFEIGGKLVFLALDPKNLDDKAASELFYYDKGWPKCRQSNA